MSSICLAGEGVLKTPRGRRRLYAFKLRLSCGRLVLLHGANGAGKTLLLKAASGLVKGVVSGWLYAARPLLYAPAYDFHLDGVTIGEWLWLHGVRGLSGVEGGAPLSSLSRGWRRFVELYAAIESGARVMLLDEPFSGLDERLSERLASLVARAVARGSLVVIASPEGEAERIERLLAIHSDVLHPCGINGGVLNCAA